MDTQRKYLLILGANSDLGFATAKLFAESGFNLYLASRNESNLRAKEKELKKLFNIDIKIFNFNLADFNAHDQFYAQLDPKPEGVLCVAGYLPDQQKAEKDIKITKATIETNFLGPVSIFNIISRDFEKCRRGFIIGVSSVAGERGRASNYIYGSAKAGFSAYLSGLRNRLGSSNIHVLTVLPGFMKTKMTAGLDLPDKLTSDPDQGAKAIFSAWEKKRNIIYVSGIWRFIMLVIRMIPERIFKKMKI